MTPSGIRRAFLAASLALGALAVTSQAHAQSDWPRGQTITVIVPFTPGSGTDVIARLFADKLAIGLGTSVVIQNRPGAGGTIGAAQVAKAPPDGYTLLVHSAGHVVNPSIYPNLSYDTLKDFAGVSPLATLPNVLIVKPGRFTDVADLVKQAKAQPGKFNYGSAGNGSATHMNAEKFRLAAGFQAQHVPFRGTPEAITQTMAGTIDWYFAPEVSALQLVRDGKLQALAVGTPQRSPELPQVPTTAEAGVPGSEYTFWVGMFAPAKTPRPIIERLNAEIAKIMAAPEMKEQLEKQGAEPFPMKPAAYDAFIVNETAKAQDIVRKAGIKVE